LQAAKATLQVAKACLSLRAAKPSLTLRAAKASLTVLRSSRHRRPQRPRRNWGALRSVRDNNTSIRQHPTTSPPDRPESHNASDHPSTRVDRDRRARRMFAVEFAPPARVWFAPLAGFAHPIAVHQAPSRRQKTTVQLASPRVQGLSDRLALSSAFLNASYKTVT
jgi:hypothetical protein